MNRDIKVGNSMMIAQEQGLILINKEITELKNHIEWLKNGLETIQDKIANTGIIFITEKEIRDILNTTVTFLGKKSLTEDKYNIELKRKIANLKLTLLKVRTQLSNVRIVHYTIEESQNQINDSLIIIKKGLSDE
tara:strand:- start:1298 stop:1702 length:405 start_codon:yes stop_codon:yes gene_type:complete